MNELKITNLFNLDETIAKELFESYTYPWEVIFYERKRAHLRAFPRRHVIGKNA